MVIVAETARIRLTIEMRRITLRPMKIGPGGRLGAEEGRREELMSENLRKTVKWKWEVAPALQ